MRRNVKRKGALTVSVFVTILSVSLIAGMGCAHQKPKPIPPVMTWIDRGDEVCMDRKTAEDLSIYLLELEGE